MTKRRNDLFAEPMASGIVALNTIEGVAVGAGLLISDRHVLTCAHVINQTLSRDTDALDMPADPIHIEFAFVSGKADGFVRRWSAPGEDPSSDLALIEFAPDAIPAAARPIRLDDVDEMSGHVFRVLGFSETNRGLQASGVLVGRIANGWIQMEATTMTGPAVREGFSGSPVWDDEVHGVVGVVVARTMQLQDKSAYMIPSSLLTQFLEDREAPGPREVIRPLLVEFGSVDETYHMNGVVRSDTPIVHIEADDALCNVEHVGDEIYFDMLAYGELTSQMVVTTKAASVAVGVHAAIGPSAPSNWPQPPTEYTARARIDANLGRRLFARERSYDGTVSVLPRHVVRVVIESVTESISRRAVDVATEPNETTVTGRLEGLALPLGWGNQTFRTPLSTPIRIACYDCDDRHTVPCPSCRGRGRMPCPLHTNSCRMCYGNGLVDADNRSVTMFNPSDKPRFRCPRCNGTGEGRCDKCGGGGIVTCLDCVKGRVKCDRCGGRGRRFRYSEGTIQHSLIVDRMMTDSDEGLAFAHADAPWRPVRMDLIAEETYTGDLNLQGWLAEQLSGRYENEIARRVHAEILPVFAINCVDWPRERPIYLVGDHKVETPRPRTSKKGIAFRRSWLADSEAFSPE